MNAEDLTKIQNAKIAAEAKKARRRELRDLALLAGRTVMLLKEEKMGAEVIALAKQYEQEIIDELLGLDPLQEKTTTITAPMGKPSAGTAATSTTRRRTAPAAGRRARGCGSTAGRCTPRQRRLRVWRSWWPGARKR